MLYEVDVTVGASVEACEYTGAVGVMVRVVRNPWSL